MPKIIWAICCERLIVDKASNNLSLINVLEQFNPDNLPVTVPQIYNFVSLWQKDEAFVNKEEIFKFKFAAIHNPESIPENKFATIECKIPVDKKRLRHLFSIRGMPIEEYGTLYLIIQLEIEGSWREIYRIPIEIVKKK